jgi:two-component system, NtrC family, nitrogen regulation sensor histidine kinase NtrY
MASERDFAAAAPRSAVRRAWLYCLLLALPALIFAGHFSLPAAIGAGARLLLWSAACCFICCWWRRAGLRACPPAADALQRGLVAARGRLLLSRARSRHQDAFRRTGCGGQRARRSAAEAARALARATALLARILEVMHAPLFAFDRENLLQLVNNAGVKLLGLPMPAASATPRANWAWKTCWPLPIRAFTPSDQADALAAAQGRLPPGRRAAHAAAAGRCEPAAAGRGTDRLEAADPRAGPRAFELAGAHQVHRRQPAGARGSHGRRREATLHDFRRGLGVVESRADSLHRFVQSYRLLAQLPPPHLKRRCAGARCWSGSCCWSSACRSARSGPPVTLDADPDQLEQMFINLLANAVDASLANGSQPVRASWRRDGLQPAGHH